MDEILDFEQNKFNDLEKIIDNATKEYIEKKSKEFNDEIIEIKKEDYQVDITDHITSKQMTLLYSPNGLVNFYKTKQNKKILTSIIKQDTCISLRLLDWLITNYSKKYDVYYTIGKNKNNSYIPINKNFNMWKDYKNQLKSHSKKSFDPFCRRNRIYFDLVNYTVTPVLSCDYVNDESGIVTTVGQLNFFRWAIENEVIDYAFDHIQKIESDMLLTADKKTNKKQRRQLSKNNSGAKSQKTNVVVDFC
jgi:hypothetical protein